MYLNSEILPICLPLLGRIYPAIVDLLPINHDFNIPDKTPVAKPASAHQSAHLVDLAIERQISRIIKRAAVGGDESFFVADLGRVIQHHRRWVKSLPGVQPYYGTDLRSERAIRGRITLTKTSGKMQFRFNTPQAPRESWNKLRLCFRGRDARCA